MLAPKLNTLTLKEFDPKKMSYSSWKERLMSILESRDQAYVLEVDPPADTTSGTVVKKNEGRSYRIYDKGTSGPYTLGYYYEAQDYHEVGAIIKTALNDQDLALIRESSTPKAMIKQLDQLYLRKDVLSKLLYVKRMFTMNMTDTDSVEEHLDKWQSLIEEAKINGVNDNELKISEVVLFALLHSVHPKYADVITLIENCEELTFTKIKAMLISAQIRNEINDEKDVPFELHYTKKQTTKMYDRAVCTKCGYRHNKNCPDLCRHCLFHHFGRRFPTENERSRLESLR
jgi:beta-galactosidase beta subunit